MASKALWIDGALDTSERSTRGAELPSYAVLYSRITTENTRCSCCATRLQTCQVSELGHDCSSTQCGHCLICCILPNNSRYDGFFMTWESRLPVWWTMHTGPAVTLPSRPRRPCEECNMARNPRSYDYICLPWSKAHEAYADYYMPTTSRKDHKIPCPDPHYLLLIIEYDTPSNLAQQPQPHTAPTPLPKPSSPCNPFGTVTNTMSLSHENHSK